MGRYGGQLPHQHIATSQLEYQRAAWNKNVASVAQLFHRTRQMGNGAASR
jgi:hypothetical protein